MNTLTFGDKVQFYLLFLFIILKPFYLWESGLPQAADLVFLVFIIFSSRRKGDLERNFNGKVIMFFTYAVIINLIFRLFYYEKDLIYASIYLVFLGIGAIKVNDTLSKSNRIKNALYNGCRVTTYLQFILLCVTLGQRSRETIFFNNPNQLGYYFLCIMTIFMILALKREKRLEEVFILTLNFITITFSQSRAAIGGALLLIIIFLWKRKMFNLKRIWIVLIFITTFLFANEYYFSEQYRIVNIISSRVESKKEEDFISARGYNRIYYYPKYLLFGSGKGGYDRYNNDIRLAHTNEIHSLYGSIFFSYGLVGLALFLRITGYLFNSKSLFYWALFSPIMIYNLTHNGIRSQLFWIILVLLFQDSANNNNNNKEVSHR